MAKKQQIPSLLPSQRQIIAPQLQENYTQLHNNFPNLKEAYHLNDMLPQRAQVNTSSIPRNERDHTEYNHLPYRPHKQNESHNSGANNIKIGYTHTQHPSHKTYPPQHHTLSIKQPHEESTITLNKAQFMAFFERKCMEICQEFWQ